MSDDPLPLSLDFDPPPGVLVALSPLVRRVVAPNPGPMTYWGTNTYLLDGEGGTAVLDPGPDDAAHVRAVLDAAGGRVAAILVTHSHRDHVGALPALRAATGAPVHGWARPTHAEFVPDVPVADGDVVLGMRAVHTPGHSSDHLVFARPDGVVFSGDQVMGWSSTVVSPPDGNMTAYFASLHQLLGRTEDTLYLPGHGPGLPSPLIYVEQLLAHRMARETAILTALREGPRTVAELTARLYDKAHPRLMAAAQRNVVAHLQKLEEEGRVAVEGDAWRVI